MLFLFIGSKSKYSNMKSVFVKKWLFSGIFLLSFFFTFSQKTNIDNLLTDLKIAEEDTAKVNLYSKIARHYLLAQIDSSLVYIQEGVDLANKIKYTQGQIEMLNLLGNYYENKTNYHKSLEIYDQALEIAKKTNDIKGFATLYNNIGMVHIRQGRYDVALPMMIEALKAEEQLKNDTGIAQSFNNIGVIYFYQQNFDKATEYFEKSIVVQEKTGDTIAIKQAINNLGAIYDYLQQYEKAIAQYNKALTLNTANNDKKEMSINLHNIAVAHFKLKKYDASESYYQQSIQLKEEMGDYNGMALSYFNYGELLRNSNRPEKAKEYFITSLKIAEENGLKETLQKLYASMSALYEKENNYKAANEYLYKYIAVKDSVLNVENSRILAETEAKYQTEKKEKELAESKILLTEKEHKIKEQNMFIYGTLALALLLGVLGYLLYKQQKLKNEQLQKENMLKEALHEIATQNQLQEQRLQISRDLHDNIGSQLTFIISSLDNIKYALKEKNETLTNKIKGISNFTANTIYELRDTIWAMNKSNISFEDLHTRINNFIINAKESSKDVKFHFTVNKSLEEKHLFTSVEGMNLYRIIQEAVNNSLKYAQAKNINVEISETEDQLLINISDDGIGFDSKNIEEGNGLNNMRKRAKEINAKYQLQSTSKKGTFIQITMDKKHLQLVKSA